MPSTATLNTAPCPIHPQLLLPNPCPREECPLHVAGKTHKSGCAAHAVADMEDYRSRVEWLVDNNLFTGDAIDKQVAALGRAVSDYASLSVRSLNGSGRCTSCGYPTKDSKTKCASASLCEERTEAIRTVELNFRGVLPNTSVWEAVLSGRHSFLPANLVRLLAPLCSTPRKEKQLR